MLEHSHRHAQLLDVAAWNAERAEQLWEKLFLDLAHKYLTSPYLEQRLTGISYYKVCVRMKDRHDYACVRKKSAICANAV